VLRSDEMSRNEYGGWLKVYISSCFADAIPKLMFAIARLSRDFWLIEARLL
jgi:hypothetical protein